MKLFNIHLDSATALAVALLAAVAPVADAQCALPSTYRWRSTGPLAQPRQGWSSIKDFTHVPYQGKHLIYGSYFAPAPGPGWSSFNFGLVSDWYVTHSAACEERHG